MDGGCFGGWWRVWRLFFRRARLVFGGGGVRCIYSDLMLPGLLLKGDDVRKIQRRHAGESIVHEFQPDRERSTRSGFFFAQRDLLIVVAHPDTRSQLGSEADKPGIGIVLGGAGFARGWTAKYFCLNTCTKLDNLFEHGGHGARNIRRDDIVDLGMRFLQERTIIAGDATNGVGVDADAVVGKDGEGRDVFHEAHVRRAQRQWQVGRQGRGDAKAARHVDDGGDTNSLGQFYGWYVAGAGKGTAQRDGAFKFFVVIAGRVGLATADGGKG